MHKGLKSPDRHSNRNSNIELLRIISMILIVAYHATRIECIKSGESLVASITGIVFGSWGILGVDLFVIISSWYLIGRDFSCKRVLSVVFQTSIYIVLSSLLSCIIIVTETHSFSKAIKALLLHIQDSFFEPLWCRHFWFVTAYVFLLVLTPFLNMIILKMSKKTFRLLLIIGAFVPFFSQFNGYTNIVSDVMTFSYIFLLIGYIKQYGIKNIERYCKFKFIVLIIGAIICGRLLLLISNLIDPINLVLLHSIAAVGRHSMIMLFAALLVFFRVIKKEPKTSMVVNRIARYTFGVYLFHSMHILTTDGDLLDYIARKLIDAGLLNGDLLFPIMYIVFVFAIFSLGLLVDFLLQKLMITPLLKIINYRFSKKYQIIDTAMSIE